MGTHSEQTERAIEVYVHVEGAEDPRLVKVDVDGIVADLLTDDGAPLVAETIWTDGQDDPLDPSSTLADVGVTDRSHVHHGRCREVKVLMRHNGRTIEELFGPAVHIRRVMDWATGPEGFKLPIEQVPKHALRVPGSDHVLVPEVHVGSLVDGARCVVVLDLAPKERFEG